MMTSKKQASAKASGAEAGQSTERVQTDEGDQISDHVQLNEHSKIKDADCEIENAARPKLTMVSNNADFAGQTETKLNSDILAENNVRAEQANQSNPGAKAIAEAKSKSDTQPQAPATNATKATAVLAEKLVHEGDDGWLFLVAGSNHVLNMYQHKSSFTPTMAKAWVKLLKDRSKRFSSKGIQYLHLPAPEKLTVLHKFYRGKIENIEGSPIHQMAKNHAADIPCLVNVLPLFAKQVDKTLLYWKTDTHWSFWGCFSAYQLLCARMGVKPNTDLLQYPYSEGPVLFDLGAKLEDPIKETGRFYQLTQNAQRSYANTMVRYKEEQGLINEANLHVGSSVVYRNKSENAVDKCVMLFGDSFSEYRDHLLTGMLAETFREVHFVWNGSIDYKYVDKIKPDVVITELAERFMTRIPDDKFDVQAFAAERLAAFTPGKNSEQQSGKFARPSPAINEQVIMPSEAYHLHPPKVVQKDCKNAGSDKVMKTTPIRLLDVKKAKVFFTGDKLLVRAQGGEMVKRYGVTDQEFNALPWSEHRELHGTALMLGDSMGAHCYYHWMLDLLPKLGIVEKAGIKLSSIDHFLVREMNDSFHKQTLERLGIDAARIVQTRHDNHVECERLLMVKFDNGINLKMNRFIPNWMKHLYPPVYPIRDRIKLYISRPAGVRRGVANEQQLFPILRRAGYTIKSMEGMSVLEQAQLLSRADVLVSPHGGALTNMVFCKPGIKVVELFGRHVYPFYYGLAQMCGHEYHAIVENTEDYPRLIQYAEASKVGAAKFQKLTRAKSFNVDLDVFKATLDAVEH